MTIHDILGAGWAFPIRLDSQGRFALSRREQDIDEAIRMILLTPIGQRIMRPEFGCRIHELLFAPNDLTTAGLAKYYVEEALAMWEPRITVQDIVVTFDPQYTERLLIEIRYQVKTTHDQRSLVFPFYRVPGE